jgi:hypothetical protein
MRELWSFLLGTHQHKTRREKEILKHVIRSEVVIRDCPMSLMAAVRR